MAVYLDSKHGTWQLPQGRTLIGRGEACGLRLDDMRLSRKHAILDLDGTRLVVSDNGSANGVLVNDDRIAVSTQLADGDVLVTGPFLFRIRIEPETEDPSRLVSGQSGTPPPTPKRTRSDEFMPSTDRASRHTVDMAPVEIPESEEAEEIAKPAALTARVDSKRQVAAVIQDAVQSRTGMQARAVDGGPKPPSARKVRTDILMPSDLARRGSDPLIARSAEERALLADDQGDPETSGILPPRRLPTERPSIPAHLAAVVLDPLLAVLLAAAVLVIAIGGSWLGAWYLAEPEQRLPLADLVGHDGHQHLWHQVQVWRTGAAPAFILAFVGAIAGALGAALALLFWLVVPTLMRGGPPVQRRLGLVLLDRRGWYPAAWRAALRTALLLATWPLAVVGALCGLPGLHDLASGCHLRRKPVE